MLRLDVSVSDENIRGYDIPRDNPYGPGAVVADGALTTGQSRWLTWASGLRNPWRFSFDDPAVGGWVPPNHPLALGAGTPTPTPAPTPSPTSSSCSGSDPFSAFRV